MDRCRPKPSHCKPAGSSKAQALSSLVAEYKKLYAPQAACEAEFFRTMPSIDLMIHHVAFAIDGTGRCFDHQFRIQRAARREAKRLLTAALVKIEVCRSFDELHSLLLDVLSGVHGVGELYIYDAAQRIGSYLGLPPSYIYLHAGVRHGAAALGLDTSRGVLDIYEFPKPLRKLPADELENFLCIYKNRF